jgi:hypothetical protein
MSPQIYDRWYIVPAVEFTDSETGETYTAPKYSDRDGISGFSGNTFDESILEAHYPALKQIYPGLTWYIVRFYGTWTELNNISVLGDTRNLATNAEDVNAILSQRFPDLPSDTDWSLEFFVDN